MFVRRSVLALVAGFAFTFAAFAADPVFVGAADGGGKAAIRGYDPVAYFLENKPVQGKPEFKTEWHGAEWRFASAANRDAFVKDPVRYAPAFGGYCAYGASNGYKVSTEPAAFAIEGGKLYLNHSIPVQNTWNKDRPGYIEKATAKWPSLEAEPYETDGASVAKAKAEAQAKAAAAPAAGR
jgi:YHS domain-containing protein